jgi:predicted  nucleic acid-binding Zn-ribbon protein
MQYKGDDLDLRVAQGRQARESFAAPEYEPAPTGGRCPRASSYASAADPLWVDEVLLACCNYAYDIAIANGAGEVGLEHLVNALTRVEAAARILEARGVREAQLRRESATLIASEIPVSAASERVHPRRGPDFEDVLRRAAEQASRRGTGASMDDVLWVILHHNLELPAVMLLRRLTPDWQRLDWGRTREPAPAPAPHQEFVRYVGPTPAAMDTFSGRIAQIEDSLRGLHADLAAERKVLADLIRDAQRDIVAQRGDAASLRSDMAQRLEALERGVQARNDTSRLTVQLSDRVQSLEKAVHGGLGEGARNWAALGQRLQTIEASLEARQATADLAPMIDRLQGIEQTINGRVEASARVWNGFAERLQAVERTVEAGSVKTQWAPLMERLEQIEATLRNRPVGSAGVEVTALSERLGGLERAVRAGFGDAAQMTTTLFGRMDAFERRAAELQPATDPSEAVLILDDRMQSVERMLQDRMAVPAADNQQLLAVAEVVRETASRLAGIEQQVQAYTAASEQAIKARDADVKEMHEAIVRLSENQLTLASAIADWRHEAHNDFGAINTQIEKLTVAPMPQVAAERPPVMTAAVPVAEAPVEIRMREQMAENVTVRVPAQPRMPEAVDPVFEPDRERARTGGFWWWLFGTSSVTQANRDAEIRWQKMHERLREARERRRTRA